MAENLLIYHTRLAVLGCTTAMVTLPVVHFSEVALFATFHRIFVLDLISSF